jgi:mRNA interferase MazF
MTICKYEQWDIVLVPFPFTDLTSMKKRPALILSGANYNNMCSDYILCGITSQSVRSLEQGDFILTDIAATGLIKTSVIRLGRLGTFHESTIIKKIGNFPEDKQVEIQGILLNIQDIDINQFK